MLQDNDSAEGENNTQHQNVKSSVEDVLTSNITEKTPTATNHIQSDLYRRLPYRNLEKGVFKTINRLVDDISVDMMFLHNNALSYCQNLPCKALRRPGIEYSQHIGPAGPNFYSLHFLDRDPDFAQNSHTLEVRPSYFNEKDQIFIIRAITYNPDSFNESTLSQGKVFHIQIMLKVIDNSAYGPISHMSEFHLVEKLNQQDKIDMLQQPPDVDSASELLKSALPKVLDEATYVCAKTGKVLRIVISEPEFDSTDLLDYENDQIKKRHTDALEKLKDLSKELPSPALCLHTLYKAINGPLKLKINDTKKTIQSNNQLLNSRINADILPKRLQFEVTDTEFSPPLISDWTDKTQDIIRESYIRKRLEIILLGSKADPGSSVNPFNKLHFSSSPELLFQQLGDISSSRSHRFIRDPNYINISVHGFYSDDLVIQCYKNTVLADPKNEPVYFDNLIAVARQRQSRKLDSFIFEERDRGICGQIGLREAYKDFNLNYEQGALIDDVQLLAIYKSEKKTLLY